MVHPAHSELNLYLDNRLADKNRVEQISAHLDECEFCSEYCDNYRRYQKSLVDSQTSGISEAAQKTADRVYCSTFAGDIIQLRPLAEQNYAGTLYLAADGGEQTPKVINVATLYSESPEMVLRLMHDQVKGVDYVQLMSADAGLVGQVMIQVPDSGAEFMTDNQGRTEIEGIDIDALKEKKWQVKLPDATFSLSPLKYDHNCTEDSNELTLATSRGDKLLVKFEQKTEGSLISLKVLELNGKAEFGHVKVAISQQDVSRIESVEAGGRLSVSWVDPDQEISIRLFQ